MSCHQLLDAISDLIKQAVEDERIVVKRSDLVTVVERTTKRGDALMTLPLTLVYIVVFMGIVTLHLDIKSRQEVEHALADWVDGRDPRTDCTNNCDDMESFWEWLLGDDDGLAGIFAVPRGEKGKVRYYVANQNFVVNDVWLQRFSADGSQESHWLIRSDQGKEYLEKHPHEYSKAAQEAARYLRDDKNWKDPSIKRIRVRFITFNQIAHMYSITEVDIRFSGYSKIYANFRSHAVSIAPYKEVGSAWWVVTIISDILFVGLVIKMAVAEIKDMISYARLGFRAFYDYWTFWNIVDWISIGLGVATVLIWAILSGYTRAPIFHEVSNSETEIMTADIEMSSLYQQVQCLYYVYSFLHCVMALNTISIVLKFFKAFTANKRLRVVTDTFREAVVDFVHFGIIFTTIFLPFITVGHVLFGNDIEEFSSMFASVNTGLQAVLGHFEWYAELATSSNFYSRLPSGMPVFFVFIWYVTYMFMVMLVLLNMLLAIIIDKYTEIANRLNSDDTDNLKIWEQVQKWREMRRETRHFPLRLSEILRELERKEEPAHPPGEDGAGDDVKVDSIIEAFKGMSKEQAIYLLRYIKEQCNRQAQASTPTATIADLMGMLEDQKTILNQLAAAPISSAESSSNNKALQRLERLEYHVSELAEAMNHIRVDQAGLARRLKKIKDCVEDSQGNSTLNVPKTPKSQSGTPKQEDERNKNESLQQLLRLHDTADKRNGGQRLQLPQAPSRPQGPPYRGNGARGLETQPLVHRKERTDTASTARSERSDWFPRSMASGSRRQSEDLDNGPQWEERE